MIVVPFLHTKLKQVRQQVSVLREEIFRMERLESISATAPATRKKQHTSEISKRVERRIVSRVGLTCLPKMSRETAEMVTQ